jgi:hypothetical protein
MIVETRIPTRGPDAVVLFIASDGGAAVEAEVQQDGEDVARPLDVGPAVECAGTSLRSVLVDGLTPATTCRVSVWQGNSGNDLTTSTLPRIGSALRFRYGILSDPHCSLRDDIAPGGRMFSHSLQLLETSLQRLHHMGVDFVAIPGDLVNAGRDDEIEAAKRVIDASPVPCRALVGNHESRPEPFIEAFGLPTCGYYSFDHKGLHFICIRGRTSGDLLPDRDQHAWFRDDLTAHSATPTIIFSHYCLAEMPYIAREDDYHVANVAEMSSLLRAHPQVKAVFAGHKNLPSLRRDAHVAHVLCPQIVGYSAEFDVVDIHEDGLMRRIHQIAELDLLWLSRGMLDEARASYRFGEEEARNFVHEW